MGSLTAPGNKLGQSTLLEQLSAMLSREVKNLLPVLCPARLVYFCHFWVTERLDLRHRVAFPRPHRYPLAPPGWVTRPVPHGVYIWHREDSSKAGHRSHRSLIALSGPDVHLIEMYSLVFVYHSRLLSCILAKSYPMYLNNGQIIPLYGARTRFSAWIIRLSWLPRRLIIWAFNSESTAQK